MISAGPQEGVADATDPSGPNSVLSGVTHSVGVPLLIRGCTDELIARLQVNVPLSSLLVSRTFAVKDPALGRAD
ncbi:protein of unknown function [Micropruina glycogenica]|uniref:Uncharacterized protein n=1 Tax=Micropruina glycogenica TaxID=75385 RepID=A0A2N9JFA7_9ACTN|nr:protein of unknown function [Micropruina glycogenica]